MRANREFVLKKFLEFNALIFGNALDPLPIVMTESKHFLGLCVFKRRALPGAAFDIRISSCASMRVRTPSTA